MNKNRFEELENAIQSGWRKNKNYNQVSKHRIKVFRASAHNTSPNPYDDHALNFLDDAEFEIKDDYKSRRRIRIGLIVGLIVYFIFVGYIVFRSIFYDDDTTLKLILSGGFFSSFIGLLIIVFKYAFTSSDKYYEFIENIMHWAYEQHCHDS